MKVSQQTTVAADEQVKSLHQRRPELAELAARVAEGKSDLAERRKLADEYFAERVYPHAYDLYRQIALEVPEEAGVELALARMSDDWSDYLAAIRHARTAVRLEPNSTQPWDVLARIHLHAGELDAARSAWTTAVQINGENASALANLGYVFLLERNWQQARMFLEEALEQDGSLVEARNNLGIALARAGNDAAALQQFTIVNRPAVAYNNLGVVKLDEGLWLVAAQAFKQALAYEPDYVTAQDNLTEVQAYLPRPTVVELPPFRLAAVDAAPALDVPENPAAPAPDVAASSEVAPVAHLNTLGSTVPALALSGRPTMSNPVTPEPDMTRSSSEPSELLNPPAAAAQPLDASAETVKPEPQQIHSLQTPAGFEFGNASIASYWLLAILGITLGYTLGKSIVGMVVVAENRC